MAAAPALNPDAAAQHASQVCWQAIPDWEAILFGPKGLRLAEWGAEGNVQVVKHGAHRTVYHVQIPHCEFYVKRYRRDRLPDALGHLVRPSAARREWHKAAEVARRGIATAKPVAWIEQIRGHVVRDSFLVTEAIRPACSLDQYVTEVPASVRPEMQAAMRRQIVRSVARFIAAVHEAGITHDDFHVGNVLVRLGARDDPCRAECAEDCLPELYLIDVPGVRFTGPLGWRASRASLIMFGAGWWERSTSAERLRFWRTYLGARPGLKLPDERKAIHELALGSRAYCRRVTRRRDRRTLRTNRDYVALRAPHGTAHAVADLDRTALDRLLGNPEALLEQNLHRPVKLSHSKLIVEAELPLAGRPVRVAFARFRYRNRWKALLGRFRRNRALRGWTMGHALRARGITAARPVAVCQVRRSGRRPESYLATQWIDGAENLHVYGWRLAGASQRERLRRAARTAESLGDLVGRMHAWCVCHGDLKAGNLLVVEREGRVETYVIDAEDVRIACRLTWRRRVRDLARLATGLQAHAWVSRTILCRFLRAYVRQLPPGTLHWKTLWRDVARRSGRMIHRKSRRGRPVL